MPLHEKIKIVRLSKKIKQATIANEMGLTVQAYSMKERGKRPITTDELEVISQVLDVPILIFFENNFNVKFKYMQCDFNY